MKTIEGLSRDLEEAYGALSNWMESQARSEIRRLETKLVLEEERARYLVDNEPKVLGANEEQRAAKLLFLCKDAYESANEAEIARIGTKQSLDAALMRIEHLRAQLRILELQAGIQRAA